MSGALVFLGLWLGACAVFGFGWIFGHAAALSAHADDLLERWSR